MQTARPSSLDTLSEAFRLDRAIRKHAFNAQRSIRRFTDQDALQGDQGYGMPHLKRQFHFAMGKVYKRLGQTEQTISAFDGHGFGSQENQLIKSQWTSWMKPT
jgi:hypothetical protein